jgi:signal transduction histidine kinase
MRDRVGALDGTLAIDSKLSQGTTVSGRVPAVPAQVSQVA